MNRRRKGLVFRIATTDRDVKEGRGTATGEDDIPVDSLMELVENSLRKLTSLVNRIYETAE